MEPDPTVDLDGSSDGGLQSVGEGWRQAAAPLPGPGGVAELPASLDRSGWRLPAGGPAAVEELELWDQERFRCHAADDFEVDPRAEPSVLASLEASLSTYDE